VIISGALVGFKGMKAQLYQWYDWKFQHSSLSYVLAAAYRRVLFGSGVGTTTLYNVKIYYCHSGRLGDTYTLDVSKLLPSKFASLGAKMYDTALLVNSEIDWISGDTTAKYFHLDINP